MPVSTIEKSKKLQLKREKLKREHPRLYIARYHHLNVHGHPMEFGDKYRFLIPLYKGIPEFEVYRKAVQSGISELLILTALWEAMTGLRILYVMPNIDLRGKFVKDRLDRLLRMVPFYAHYLKHAVGSSTSIGLKHFGKGIMNFVGSNSPAEFISYPADSLIIDEVDKCDQKNLEMAPDRLDASDYKYDIRAGNPSVEKWGIDAVFLDSTQSEWKVKCPHCGKRQSMDFFRNVVKQVQELKYDVIFGDKNNPLVVCRKCHKPIDRLGPGEWIDKVSSVRKGKHISQLFSSNIVLKGMVDIFYKSIGNPIKTQLFYNSKLGLPYAAEGSKVTYETLEKSSLLGPNYSLVANDTTKTKGVTGIYVGIDVGKYYYAVARTRLRDGTRMLVYVGRHLDTKSLMADLKILNARVLVIDELPETREVETIKKYFPKLYSCEYLARRTFLDIKKKAQEYKKGHSVKIDRTFILDSIKKDYSNSLMVNPNNAKELLNEEMEEYGEYYQQLTASTRVFNESTGRFDWRESSPDHLFHAEAYCKLAEEMDDRILQFYKDRNTEYEGKTKVEVEAQEAKSRPLIPKTEQEMMEYTPEDFLSRLSNKPESILGEIKNTRGKPRGDTEENE